MLKAVAFDVDGTLYPQWRINLASVPLYLKHCKLVNAYWRVRREVRRENIEGRVDDLRRYQSEMIARHRGWDPQQTHQRVEGLIYGIWNQLFFKISIYPGLLEVLTQLKQRGLKLGVLSDFPVQQKLKDLGINGWWDVAFCSEDLQLLKPNAGVFARMVAQLDCQPDEVLYVGNHYHYDIQGGQRAGLHTAHLTWRPRRASPADFHFCSYRHFLKKFDRLQQRLG